MGRTAVNVAGQALVPTIVAEREGMLDEERFCSTSAARHRPSGGLAGPGPLPGSRAVGVSEGVG